MTPSAGRPTYLQLLSIGGAMTAAIVASVTTLAMMGVGFLFGNYGLIYASVACLAFLLPLGAGLLRGRAFDPFEPINLVALAFLYGTSLRAIWLLTSDSSRVDFIMMGTDMQAVSANSPLMLLSVICLVAGYVAMPFRFPLERLAVLRQYRLSRQRTRLALAISIGISLIGIPWMIAQFGISFDAGILSASTKRLATFVNSEGEVVYGAGFQRWLASAAQYGFMLLGAAIIAGLVRPRPFALAMLAVMFGLSTVTPFLTSSRSSLLLLGVHLAIFAYYYRRLTIRALALLVAIALTLLALLGDLREANQMGAVSTDISATDRVLGSGNSIDLVRTSAIMDRVPQAVDYQYGLTYAALPAAVVPRAMWPDKPNVGLGGFVKGEIFGQDVRLGGWPSGMIAEGWINFGMLGLFVPMALFGALLRLLYESFRPLLGVSLPVTLIYAVSIWRFGFGGVGMNFAHAASQTLVYVAPTVVMLLIARQPLSQQYRRLTFQGSHRTAA